MTSSKRYFKDTDKMFHEDILGHIAINHNIYHNDWVLDICDVPGMIWLRKTIKMQNGHPVTGLELGKCI